MNSKILNSTEMLVSDPLPGDTPNYSYGAESLDDIRKALERLLLKKFKGQYLNELMSKYPMSLFEGAIDCYLSDLIIQRARK